MRDFLGTAYFISAVCMVAALFLLNRSLRNLRYGSVMTPDKNVTLYYVVLSTLVAMYAAESIAAGIMYSLEPYPDSYVTVPWDTCYWSGLFLVALNVAIMCVIMSLSCETWVIICCLSNKRDCPKPCVPLLNPAVRGRLYSFGAVFTTLVFALGIGLESGYGKNKDMRLCSLNPNATTFNVYEIYQIFTALVAILPVLVSIRVIMFVRGWKKIKGGMVFAVHVLLVPLSTSATNIPPFVCRELLPEDTKCPPLFLDSIAALKGTITLVAILMSNKNTCSWLCKRPNGHELESSSIRTSFLPEPAESDQNVEISMYNPPTVEL